MLPPPPTELKRSQSPDYFEVSEWHAQVDRFTRGVECVLPSVPPPTQDGNRYQTTLMLRNIPRDCTLKNLEAKLDEKYRGRYDFLYLPVDLWSSKRKNGWQPNKGYCFLNMTSPEIAMEFIQNQHLAPWAWGKSAKVCEV